MGLSAAYAMQPDATHGTNGNDTFSPTVQGDFQTSDAEDRIRSLGGPADGGGRAPRR
ncbi:MAG: hypothetical protein AAF288_13860 [Planctomycetota bacterium]